MALRIYAINLGARLHVALEALLLLEISTVDALGVLSHASGLLGYLELCLCAQCVLYGVGNGFVKGILLVFFVFFHGHLLCFAELLLAQNSLSYIEAVHVTPIADITEAEVQVAAVEAKPVADTLSESILGGLAINVLLNTVFDAHLFEGHLNALFFDLFALG